MVEAIFFTHKQKHIKMKTLSNNVQELPKWAQSEIRVLQMILDEANKELDRINDNPESNTIVGYTYKFKTDRPIKYLANNQMITFILPTGQLSARINNDTLEVSGLGLSESELFVKPRVSNSIGIHLIKQR